MVFPCWLIYIQQEQDPLISPRIALISSGAVNEACYDMIVLPGVKHEEPEESKLGKSLHCSSILPWRQSV